MPMRHTSDWGLGDVNPKTCSPTLGWWWHKQTNKEEEEEPLEVTSPSG